jgi:hypothetical protein
MTKLLASRRAALASAALLPVAATGASAQPAAAPDLSRFDALANPPMNEGRPTDAAARTLVDEMLFQRATQTWLWALPLMNTLGMKLGSEAAFGAGYNVLPVWKKRLDARTLVTTPNSDVIYAMGYADLGKDGPLVIEVPPRLQGILLDFWQHPIPGPAIEGRAFVGDVGFAGPDKGEGGRYVLLPPGHGGPVPDGHFAFRSATNNVFIFWRAFYESPDNLTPAVELIEGTRIYPLGRRDAAAAMVFPDASGRPVDMLPLRDGRAFAALKALVDSEPAELADPAWRGMMAGIGIVKGRPFTPDARQQGILDRAARAGYQMSRAIGNVDVLAGHDMLVYPDRHWTNPLSDGTIDIGFNNVRGGFLALDARVNFFTNYYSISPGMVSRVPGQGANFMITWRDADGAFLSGGQRYRLRLPKDVPAANFWSVTLYDASNSSGLDNGQPFPSFGSRDRPAVNADGSTDILFGPERPQGQRNFLRTVPGKGYFAILRLYGPTEASFDKSWKPGDFETLR